MHGYAIDQVNDADDAAARLIVPVMQGSAGALSGHEPRHGGQLNVSTMHQVHRVIRLGLIIVEPGMDQQRAAIARVPGAILDVLPPLMISDAQGWRIVMAVVGRVMMHTSSRLSAACGDILSQYLRLSEPQRLPRPDAQLHRSNVLSYELVSRVATQRELTRVGRRGPCFSGGGV